MLRKPDRNVQDPFPWVLQRLWSNGYHPELIL